MADVTIRYKGNAIAEMSEEGTKTLKTGGMYCEGDISVVYTPSQTPSVESDVIGTLDQSNNVLLEGNLADGTYTFKYKKNNGTYETIGIYTLDNKVYYSVTSNLTNCTSNNGATTVVGGTSYSATITVNSGYNLSSIVVTMGGTNITSSAVSGNTITIANITGNIVITAVAEKPSYTNLAIPNDTNTTWSNDWVNNARMGSDGSYRSSTNSMVTNCIEITRGETIYFANTGFTSSGNGVTAGWQIGFFQTINGMVVKLSGGTPADVSAYATFTYNFDGTIKTMEITNIAFDNPPIYFRLCLSNAIDKSKVIISREPIT